MSKIPFHKFIANDEEVFFKIIELKELSSYNTSLAHRHNYFEIFLFNKGGGHHIIDFDKCQITDNSIHFISPGQVHLVKRELNSVGWIILFSNEFFLDLQEDKNQLYSYPFLHQNMSNPVLNLDTSTFLTLEELVLKMKSEETLKNNDFKALIRSYLNVFLIHCKRIFPSVNSTSNSVLITFKKLLEENFLEKHQVNFYYEKMGMSESAFGKAIKQNTGFTPLNLIHQRLILEAKRLLKYSQPSIKELSFHLGFSDPSHFSRFFKRNTGKSVQEFTKNGN